MFLIDGISPFFVWIIAAIVFACLELAVPGMFACIAFAIGSVAAACSSYFSADLLVQATVGFAVSILSFIFIRLQLIQAKLSEVEAPKLSTNVQALIGQEAIIIKEVLPHQTGLARVGGEIWSCKNIETELLAEGTRTLILRVQGTTLILKTT